MVRASYPEAKVLWLKEGDKEIGKRPALESHLMEVSAEAYDAQRGHTAFHAKGRKRV